MYCPTCGTQNDDLHKFCKKCGGALPSRQFQQQPVTPPSPVQSPPKTTAKPADLIASSVMIGAMASMLGGALTLIGWFMPWSKDFLTTTNGLRLTIAGFGRIFLGFSLFDMQGGLALLLILYGVVTAIAYGIIPIWGSMMLKNGYEVFEKRTPSHDHSQFTLTTLEFRARRGFILVAVLYLVPLLFSSVIRSIFPGLDLLGNLIGKLIQSETGAGIFVTAVGFAVTYIGTRYAGGQISPYFREEAEKRKANNQEKAQLNLLPLLSKIEKDVINGLMETKDETEVAKKLEIQESTLSMILLDLFHRYDAKNTEELITLLKEKHLI